MGIGLTVAGITCLLSFISDPQGTVTKLGAIVMIRGAAFLGDKMVSGLNKDYGSIIDVTGWAIAATPAVGIIRDAKGGFDVISESVKMTTNNIQSVGKWFEMIADKISFWN